MSSSDVLRASSSGSFHTALNHFGSSHSVNTANTGRSRGAEMSFKPPFQHQRVVSNPYDVIHYHSSNESRSLMGSSRYSPSVDFSIRSAPFVKPGLHDPPVSDNRQSKQAPMMTMNPETNSLYRSNSTISRASGFSIHEPHGIKKRNKMVNRVRIKQMLSRSRQSASGTSFKGLPFPVKRKSSLKKESRYTPLKSSNPGFKTSKDLKAFLSTFDFDSSMKDMMPSAVKFFDFTRLLSVVPELISVTMPIVLDDSNKVIAFEPTKSNFEFAKHPYPPPSKSQPNRNTKTLTLLDSAYDNYKDAVFSTRVSTPPRFEDIYDNDIDRSLLGKKDIERINKQLLFDVLLRRTLYAKIDYRLKQNSAWRKSHKSPQAPTHRSTPSDTSSSDTSDFPKTPKTPKKNEFMGMSLESFDTDDLIKQNVSLFSELLPSPQISYQSDIFGSIYKFEGKGSNVGSMRSADQIAPDQLPGRPRNKAKSKSKLSNTLHSMPSLQSYNVLIDQSIDMRQKSLSQMNSSKELLGMMEDIYQLKPMNRSVATFTSSESESHIISSTAPINFETRSVESSIDSSGSEVNTMRKSSERKSHRISQSTVTTSIFQHLDDISSDLSQYINESLSGDISSGDSRAS